MASLYRHRYSTRPRPFPSARGKLSNMSCLLLVENYAFSINLSMHIHIPDYPKSRKYLTVAGRAFQIQRSFIWLSPAHWIFTKVMSEIKEIVYIQGICLYLYLDWLIEIVNFNLGCFQTNFQGRCWLQIGTSSKCREVRASSHSKGSWYGEQPLCWFKTESFYFKDVDKFSVFLHNQNNQHSLDTV